MGFSRSNYVFTTLSISSFFLLTIIDKNRSNISLLIYLLNLKMLKTKISQLASNTKVSAIAQDCGLSITRIAWEDTARWKDSALGPNISDMTLCVDDDATMPIIRRPNFTDKTCDRPIEDFYVNVGNETNNDNELTSIPLSDYINNIGLYTQNEQTTSLLDKRDTVILTSTQACILPLRDGKVEFVVKLFNYQYDAKDPAVLVVVVNSNGTSTQVITKRNQSLYFNQNGDARKFNAERLSEFRRKQNDNNNDAQLTVKEKEQNMLFVYQIPLRQTKPKQPFSLLSSYTPECATSTMLLEQGCQGSFGMEDAIVSVGDKSYGRFTGTEHLKLVRDTRFPIRCTIQYYKVTDTVDIPHETFTKLSNQLSKPYQGENLKSGSLVVEGKTDRKTEPNLPTLPKNPTVNWINNF